MKPLDDTIAAVATPPGEGGIAIVRISGPLARDTARGLLRSAADGPPELSPRHATFLHAVNPSSGELLDEVLAIWMESPASYTREDVLEIQCHGGRASANAILDAVLSLGARLADPGEFTLRAFLRGRLDLVQAEAVADIIHARTSEALSVHEKLLAGALSKTVAGWQDALGSVLVHLESHLDFPEEELELASAAELAPTLDEVIAQMKLKLASFAWGRAAREGFRVAILGRPNAGKSSLLNRLAEDERAIVSHLEGTTRDTIEVQINAFGAPVSLIDTAGLREAGDEIEEEGVLRAKRAAAEADLLLLVFDGSRELVAGELDAALLAAGGKQALAVVNKSDQGAIPQEALLCAFGEILSVSALTGDGVEGLLLAIRNAAWSGRGAGGGEPLTRIRHREAVSRALSSVEAARDLLFSGGMADAAANELQRARRELKTLLGWGEPDDIIEKIFSEFCIGK